MTMKIGIALLFALVFETAVRAVNPPGEVLTLDLGGGVPMKLARIPAGKFVMGVTKDAPYRLKSDEDEHEVTIYGDFWMGVTEVTQAQYQAVMGENPTDPNKEPRFADSVIKDPRHPVVFTNIVMAKDFCKKLSDKTGKKVRLPLEEEWEYACRAGGDGLGGGKLEDVAWFKDNSDNKSHPVGSKKPNAWGLHDMLGNAGEWCSNAYIRGGNWSSLAKSCRATMREPHGSKHNDWWSSFRVVVDIQPSLPGTSKDDKTAVLSPTDTKPGSAPAVNKRLPEDARDAIIVGPDTMAQSRGSNGKIVADPKASGGNALHFRADGISTTSLGKLDLAPGRYRFTVYARHEDGKKFKLRLRTAGMNFDNAYTFFFSADPKDQSYQAQSVEWIVPGPGVASIEGAKYQSGEMLDRIVITPVAAASLLEVLDVETDKLVYRPGENPRVKVLLRNSALTAAKPTLRIVVESGLGGEMVVHEQGLDMPASPGAVPVEVPLKSALKEWGSLVRADLMDGGKVVARNQVAFAVTDSPLRVGQYGIIGSDEPYEAKGIDTYLNEFRRSYCSAVEIAFWAPCDMSQLTPPPGRDRWWSGQTFKKVSADQMRTYARRLHEQGIAFLGYVTYSNVFGYRIMDWGRRFPECLDWNAESNSGYIWWGYGQQKRRLDAPERTENDALTDLKAGGVVRTFHTQPFALKWHADQLVAGIKEYGLDGYRYDDNLEYDGWQTDIHGRRGPFPGWGTDEVFTYFRQRLREANPRTLFGHNSDPMRTGGDNMYSKHLDNPAKLDALEAAIYRDGSLGLQEAWTKAPGGKATWVQWRDRNEIAGRSAHRNGGVTAVITGFGGEPKAMTAIMLASGNRVAYTANQAHRPYLAFATRYSQFLYNADLRWLTPEDARKFVAIDAGGRDVWWAPWVRFLPSSPGKRTYLINLVNPPRGATFAESEIAEPVRNVVARLTLPQGWKAQRAWHLTADRDDLSSEYVVGRVVAGVPRAGNDSKVRLSFASGFPGASPLKLEGQTVAVPSLDCWSMIAIECEGPATDAPPSDLRPAAPAPLVPSLDAPISAERATDFEMYFQRWDGGRVVVKPGAPHELKLQSPHGVADISTHVWPMGRYRVTVRYSVAKGASGTLSLSIVTKKLGARPAKEGQGETVPSLPAFETKAEWPLIVPPHGKEGVLTKEMNWGELPNFVPFTFSTDKSEITLTGFKIECLELHDTERLKLWENGWPSGATPPRSGLNIWYGEGLFADYFGLDKTLASLPGARVETGYVWQVGQYWGGLKSLEKLQDRNMIVLGDVAIWRFTPSRLDQLRGWVENGGRLVMVGGPFAFGRGAWNLSDLMRPMYPAEIGGAYDIQPVGVKEPAVLTPVSPLAKKIDFSDSPVVLWQHVMKAKPDATVHVTAGGHPVIITRAYGKGKVCFIALTPLGDAPAGKTAFWNWMQWPELLKAVLDHDLPP